MLFCSKKVGPKTKQIHEIKLANLHRWVSSSRPRRGWWGAAGAAWCTAWRCQTPAEKYLTTHKKYYILHIRDLLIMQILIFFLVHETLCMIYPQNAKYALNTGLWCWGTYPGWLIWRTKPIFSKIPFIYPEWPIPFHISSSFTELYWMAIDLRPNTKWKGVLWNPIRGQNPMFWSLSQYWCLVEGSTVMLDMVMTQNHVWLGKWGCSTEWQPLELAYCVK